MRSGQRPDLFSFKKLNDSSMIEISESVIFSVSEVTMHLRQVIETQVEALHIVGEMSNFVRHGSGHQYFNLKDENAVIRCAFFRNLNYSLDFLPQDGDQVVCFGKISIFEKSGQYQLLVQNMYPHGKGVLQQRFEQLKLKLKNEGLFDAEHKKPMSGYPESIGIITSKTGAALQDMLNVLERRYPCKVFIFPSLMQGDDAPGQVILGLEHFNESESVDLVVIARGGGPQEDLFCFNDEKLARAIYASKLPVVSAIGHEIDFTIADFVADLRAPTPSAAAELITPDRAEISNILDKHLQAMYALAMNRLALHRNELHRYHLKIVKYYPERIWQSFQIRFDEATTRLLYFKDYLAAKKKDYLQKQMGFLKESSNLIRLFYQSTEHRIEILKIKMQHTAKEVELNLAHRMHIAETRLEELSPRKILNRGFSIVKKQGKIIKSASCLSNNDELEIILSDGSAQANVRSVRKSD
jgi:exodeoxyribonuclease VII large subunit